MAETSDRSEIGADKKATLFDILRERRGNKAALRARADQMRIEREQREPFVRGLFESAGVGADSLALNRLRSDQHVSTLPVRDGHQADALGRFTIGVHPVDRYDMRFPPYDFAEVDGPFVEHNEPDAKLVQSDTSGNLRMTTTISENQSAVAMDAWVGAFFHPTIHKVGSVYFNARVEYAETNYVETSGGATANTKGIIGLELYRFRDSQPWELVYRREQAIWDRHWSSFWAESRGKTFREPHDQGIVDHLEIDFPHEPGMAYGAVVTAQCTADASGDSLWYASHAQADLFANATWICFGQRGFSQEIDLDPFVHVVKENLRP